MTWSLAMNGTERLVDVDLEKLKKTLVFTLALGISAVLMPNGGPFNSGEALLPAATPEYDKRHFQIGHGIRSFSEEHLPTVCVTNADEGEPETTLHKLEDENSKGITFSWGINYVQSQKELFDKLDISTGAQLKLIGAIPGDVGIKANFSKEVRVNNSHDYLVMKVAVNGKSFKLDTNRKMRIRKEFAQQPKESINKYVQRVLSKCGDSYYSQYTHGGYIYTVVEISKNQRVEKMNFGSEAKLDGDAKIQKAKIEAEFQKRKDRSEKRFDAKIYSIQLGGSSSVDVPKISSKEFTGTQDELLDVFLERTGVIVDTVMGKFDEEGNLRGGSPGIVSTFFEDYTSHLDTGLRADQDVDEARAVIKQYDNNQKKLGHLSNVMADVTFLNTQLSAIETRELLLTSELLPVNDPGGESLAELVPTLPFIRDAVNDAKQYIDEILDTCYNQYDRCHLNTMLGDVAERETSFKVALSDMMQESAAPPPPAAPSPAKLTAEVLKHPFRKIGVVLSALRKKNRLDLVKDENNQPIKDSSFSDSRCSGHLSQSVTDVFSRATISSINSVKEETLFRDGEDNFASIEEVMREYDIENKEGGFFGVMGRKNTCFWTSTRCDDAKVNVAPMAVQKDIPEEDARVAFVPARARVRGASLSDALVCMPNGQQSCYQPCYVD